LADLKRFPGSVFDRGSEPDPRFSLANERTFLAWIRTSLALIAGGVALEAFGLGMHTGLRLAASIVLITLGILTPFQAWAGWARTERALRKSTPLPNAPLSMPLVLLVVGAGILIAGGVALG